MHDLEKELASRIAASQHALEAEGATPLIGTSEIIRRKRAVRYGATVGITVVAIGLLATSGAFASQYLWGMAPATPPSVAPSVSAEPSLDATVSIQVDGQDPTIQASSFRCGDPAPVSAASADGFGLEVGVAEPTLESTAFGYLTGEARVTNSNDASAPAFSLSPEIVVVRDGVVVSTHPASLGNRLPFEGGRDLLVNAFTVGPWAECGDDEGYLLAPGKYELYVVSTVANSPEVAAVARVIDRQEGLHYSEDPWLEPTDWECTHEVAWDEDASFAHPPGSHDVACLAALAPGAAWDAESRSVVLPYNSSHVTNASRAQLIAGPFDYELTASALDTQAPREFTGDACGDTLPWDEDANTVLLNTRPLYDVLRSGGGTGEALVWPEFGPSGVQARSAHVLVPSSGRAVIAEPVEPLEDGKFTGGGLKVLGHATVTVNGGDAFDVDRATGPARVPVQFEDVTWCEAEPPKGLDGFSVSITVFPDELVGGDEGTPKLRFYPLG